jgi:hypothetical protein
VACDGAPATGAAAAGVRPWPLPLLAPALPPAFSCTWASPFAFACCLSETSSDSSSALSSGESGCMVVCGAKANSSIAFAIAGPPCWNAAWSMRRNASDSAPEVRSCIRSRAPAVCAFTLVETQVPPRPADWCHAIRTRTRCLAASRAFARSAARSSALGRIFACTLSVSPATVTRPRVSVFAARCPLPRALT